MLIGAVLLIAAGNIVYTMLGIGQVKPDYQIAYVGSAALPDETAAALEEALAQLGEDANSDGRVVVRINQYADGSTSDTADAAYYNMAATAKLMADITGRESYFFLLEDPQAFQQNYHALRRLDGTLPSDTDRDWENCCIRWADCPALAELELGSYEENMLNQTLDGESQALLGEMYIARRGFWTDESSANVEACDALWDVITEGTIQ